MDTQNRISLAKTVRRTYHGTLLGIHRGLFVVGLCVGSACHSGLINERTEAALSPVTY
jgi:hypothetical protein